MRSGNRSITSHPKCKSCHSLRSRSRSRDRHRRPTRIFSTPGGHGLHRASRRPLPRGSSRVERDDRSRSLRLGYVSAFFARPNWMKPVWGLIDNHDHDRFEVHVFADGPEPGPELGYHQDPRIQFHNVNGTSNGRLAKFIEKHAIDILVDLNAFSWPARLPLFTLRPAPIQVAWFNLFAPSGLSCFDYLVGDAHVVSIDDEAFYSETVIRVPGSYMTFQVPYLVPALTPPPCLRRAHLTFGCLAPQYKITTQVVESWARILTESPGTRLVLKNFTLGQPAAARVCSWAVRPVLDLRRASGP